MTCSLNYIPKQLHTDDKPLIERFNVGEKLYYRCVPQNLKAPYDNISLKDISHNRNFKDDILFGSENVFYNILEDDDREKYEEYMHVVLLIKDIEDQITFTKEINKTNHLGVNINVAIILKHAPVPCMYPHSVFEIIVDGEIVNDDNYSKTLGKDNKFFSGLRAEIRQELTSIIQTGLIDTTQIIETIDEP